MRIEHRLPNAAEFMRLRAHTDWGVPNRKDTQLVLQRCFSGIVALEKDNPIGMARTVGDGYLILYLQDVVIAPPYRGRGLGRQLVQALLARAAQTCSADCTIGLFAAAGQMAFYEKLGFSTRSRPDYGPGMHGRLSDLAKPLNAA